MFLDLQIPSAVGQEVGQEGKEAGEGDNAAALGLVIANLQCTKQDGIACLRIFATCNAVMKLVAKRMRLRISKETLEQRDWKKK